jgi:NADPH:quinone reductase-like Zn-dependent oxidoreductase/SAM-dependent methyltransferase
MLYLEDQPWISEHKVRQDIVFPFAGYLAMAGEAARQMTGLAAGYGIRHAVAHSALVLTDAKGVETLTTLRRHRLTDADDSEWLEFSISSYTGSLWVKHFDGQVKAIGESKTSSFTPEAYPRKVKASRFYDYLADTGMNFGPDFRRLHNVSASATEQLATAEIAGMTETRRKPYTMHPAAIDACFHLLILAQARGLGRNVKQLKVPTFIEEMEVYRTAGDLRASAWGASNLKSEGIECVSDGQPALRLSGFQLTPVEESFEADFDVHAAARLEWLPDFDFVDYASLFKAPPFDRNEGRLLEELTLLCILESAHRLEGLTPKQPHFSKLADWLQKEIASAKAGTNALVPHSASLLALSHEERRAKIDLLYEKLMGMEKIGLTMGVKRIVDNCDRLFTGEVETIEVLIQDDVLTQLYNGISFGYSDFVRLLSSTKPTLRILEVGAGTGGTTELILRDLVHEGGLPRYSTYTFTDVSSGFFPQARERFAYAPNMEYKVFDITKDPLEQDFALDSYDLVVAANVVHATPSLKESLNNLRKVLKPGGILVLTELCTELRSPTYVFGNFSGWWLGEADGRVDRPYVPPARWDVDLRASGFTGVETAVYDEEAPYMCCTTIVSRRVGDRPLPENKVTVIADNHEAGIAKSLTDGLSESGWAVTSMKLGETPPKDQDMISCLDLETNFFESISEERFKAFQALLRSIEAQNMLWLTSPVQIKCRDPRSAPAIGAARTIRAELAIPFHTLEIRKAEENFNDLVMKVFHKIRTEEDDNNLVSDKEFVVDNGVICIGRYHPFSFSQEAGERSLAGLKTVRVLDIGKPGQLESLYWRKAPMPTMANDEVEVHPKAVGLNLRDVLVAMGVIDQGRRSHAQLGVEAAGIITAVGSSVEGLSVGDRVFAFAPDGILASKAIVKAHLVGKIPDEMTFEDAATVPVVFGTAMQCLLSMGRLEKGQSVLIHAACGGVGLAAIQICQMVGAEIFATVGTEEKVNYLMSKFGTPRNRIFNSRDDSFVEGVMRETGNRGVDLVLNSLSGPLLHASWKCVAEFGVMLEIGKRDLLGSGKLDLRPFLGNRSFACFAGIEFAEHRSEKFGA